MQNTNHNQLGIVLRHILIIALLSGCVNTRDNIYYKYPRGSKLSEKMLPLCDQVYNYNSDVILVCDPLNNEYYNPSLLFYNADLTLTGACYFASQKIEFLKNDTIYAIANMNRKYRINWFVNDMPEPYQLKLNTLDTFSSLRFSDKVVDSLSVDTNFNVHLFVRQSKDQFSGLNWAQKAPESFFENFSKTAILTYSLNKLNFDYKNSRILVITVVNGKILQDEMVVYDKRKFDRFYHDLFKRLEN